MTNDQKVRLFIDVKIHDPRNKRNVKKRVFMKKKSLKR